MSNKKIRMPQERDRSTSLNGHQIPASDSNSVEWSERWMGFANLEPEYDPVGLRTYRFTVAKNGDDIQVGVDWADKSPTYLGFSYVSIEELLNEEEVEEIKGQEVEEIKYQDSVEWLREDTGNIESLASRYLEQHEHLEREYQNLTEEQLKESGSRALYLSEALH